MSFKTVRDALALAVKNDTVWQTFAYPPPTPLPNSVIIMPGSSWVNSYTIDRTSVELSFVLKVCVNTADNQADLINLEDIIEAIIPLLPSWAQFDGVSSPQELQVGTADLTTVDISLRVPATL
jgi:hypothetical protein